jgi:hypothetical protein
MVKKEVLPLETKIRLTKISEVHLPNVYCTEGGIIYIDNQEGGLKPTSRKFDSRINQTVVSIGNNRWALETELMKTIALLEDPQYEEYTVTIQYS